MSKVVIVCGYGCHLTEKYEAYLRNAGDIIKYNESEIDFVVVSGGFTNIATSSVSEARLMKDVLQRCGVDNKIVEEVGAVTTLGNLTGSNVIVRAAIAQKYLVPDDICVLIFCDSIRAFKVEFLAKRVFGGIRVTVIPFDFKRSFRDKLWQWLVATPLEILSYYIPSLEKRMKEKRIALNERR